MSDHRHSNSHRSNQHPSNEFVLNQHLSNQRPSNQRTSTRSPSNQHSDQLSSLNNPINPNQHHSSVDPTEEEATKQFNSRLEILADHPILFTSPPTTLTEAISAITTSWISSPYSGSDLNESIRKKIVSNLELALATYLSQPNALQSLQAQVPSILSQATNNSKVIIVQNNSAHSSNSVTLSHHPESVSPRLGCTLLPKSISSSHLFENNSVHSSNSATSSHPLENDPASQSSDPKIVNVQSNLSIPSSSSIFVNDPNVVTAQHNPSIPPPAPFISKVSKVVNQQSDPVQSTHTPQYHTPINLSEIQYRRQRHDSFINRRPFQSSPRLPDITQISTPMQHKEDFVTPSRHYAPSRHLRKDLIPPKISRQTPIVPTKHHQQIIDIPIPIALQSRPQQSLLDQQNKPSCLLQ